MHTLVFQESLGIQALTLRRLHNSLASWSSCKDSSSRHVARHPFPCVSIHISSPSFPFSETQPKWRTTWDIEVAHHEFPDPAMSSHSTLKFTKALTLSGLCKQRYQAKTMKTLSWSVTMASRSATRSHGLVAKRGQGYDLVLPRVPKLWETVQDEIPIPSPTSAVLGLALDGLLVWAEDLGSNPAFLGVPTMAELKTGRCFG